MITNTHSWSLGLSSRSLAKGEATPNKSLDQFKPSIPIHLPGDPSANRQDPSRTSWAFVPRASVLDCGPAAKRLVSFVVLASGSLRTTPLLWGDLSQHENFEKEKAEPKDTDFLLPVFLFILFIPPPGR